MSAIFSNMYHWAFQHLKIECVILVAALFWTYLLWPWHTVYARKIEVQHDLQVMLQPQAHKLTGIDTISISGHEGTVLQLHLSQKAAILDLTLNHKPANYTFRGDRLRIELNSGQQSSEYKLGIRYEGVFNDPVPVLPLNTDNPGYGVSATISPTGCFLLAGAGWYPDLPDSLSFYRLRVDAPAGMLAVTAGRSLGHTTMGDKSISTWEVDYPVEGLALSAANYSVQEKRVGSIQAATYLLPENAHLARAYLDATAKYLALYQEMFGPYPFGKFAVVENFFPTGYGFPSYTLLGSSVIRLPFIIDTSLPHEIAHCWWGNGVRIEQETGNWSEGLATYVADYLLKEMASEGEARDYRRQLLRNFAALVDPNSDFPLTRFKSRYDAVSKTIGYDKSAMVFHMLRRKIGKNAFWGALKDIYAEKCFKRASWEDFKLAFERRSHTSLDNFFEQWLLRKKAPQLSLQDISSARADGRWLIRGSILQTPPVYDLDIDLTIMTHTTAKRHSIRADEASTRFEITSAEPPQKLTVDPDFELFRSLYASEIPPTINSLKGSSFVLVLLADGFETRPTAENLAQALGLKRYRIIRESEANDRELETNDLLWVGLPSRKDLLSRIPQQIRLGRTGFSLNQTDYDRESDAFFGVFSHPMAENHVAGLFLARSEPYAEIVARKVPHYGKYSYLAFTQGQNRDKGTWPVEASPLIYQWSGD